MQTDPGNWPPIELRPVGVVQSEIKTPMLHAGEAGIEGFSHILVLYWPHLVDPERRNLKIVHPMGRKDLPQQGIFATCSPARPNPVLVSVVPLLERLGNVLKVQGLDAVDGSPILDIKPYVQPHCGVERATVPPWMEKIHKDLGIDIR